MAKDKKENKKQPFNVLSKKGLITLAMAGVMAVSPFMLTGCGSQGPKGETGATGAQGVAGSTWHNGIDDPTNEVGVVGDYYFETGTGNVWYKTESGWSVISNLQGPQGETGAQGEKGEDGTSVYIGYDGYVWNGSTRTEVSVEASLGENVIESTIGIEETMSKYFTGSYVNLSNSTIALMANYMPNASLTQYSGTTVTQLKIVAQNAGNLYIGTAKVADVVNSRKTGVTYTATTTSYDVKAGLNTIAVNLEVAEDETIVFGGNNSVGIYVVSGIPVNDEQGNFTLVDGKTHSEVISATGSIQDTLAIQVSATMSGVYEQQIFPEVKETVTSVSALKASVTSTCPFAYSKTDLFAGKTLTQLGVPVKTISSYSADSVFTLFVIKQTTTSDFASNYVNKYELTIPANTYSSTTVNDWYYFDLSELNITLAEDESLAFFASTDTVIPGHDGTSATSVYNFYTKAGAFIDYQLYFDVIFLGGGQTTFEEHLKDLKAKEAEAIQEAKVAELASILSNKNISILGDSISTYEGYSNDSANTNSTIGSNAVYYDGSNYGITSVDQTWWKQLADKTDMNVLVNNSYSGDRVTTNGQTRCIQLHDDTGENANTNPDVIAVYLGINDFNNSVAVSTFETSYKTMIENLTTTYSGADVYLFTFVPNKRNTDNSTLLQYNEIVKATALQYGCNVVDLYEDSGITADNCSNYMVDTNALHPNKEGMKLMAEYFWNVLYENYVTNAD